jgi:D-glycero-alpha-D-manno-heptose 1-phosphate guanylyltransferase
MAAGNLEEDEPFLVLNGDTYCNASLDAIRQHHQQHEADITMVVKAVDLTDRYGLVELGSAQRIKAFHSREESGQDGGLINTGIYLVEVPVIGAFRLNPSGKTSLESDIFPALLESRVLSAYRTGAEFIDIGIPEDYALCAQVIAGIQMHN